MPSNRDDVLAAVDALAREKAARTESDRLLARLSPVEADSLIDFWRHEKKLVPLDGRFFEVTHFGSNPPLVGRGADGSTIHVAQ